jgi:signal transduction histidine kinase/CheY-like chemotaxis protein
MQSTKPIREGFSRIKPKVLFGFILLLLVALAAVIFTFTGFRQLISTRQSLSEPSRKLILLNSTLTDIYEAESNIRAYTLNQDPKHLNSYLSVLKRVNKKVDSLYILTQSDSLQGVQIMYIKRLLKRKNKVLNDYIDLKQTDWSAEFYNLALNEIGRLETDSILRDAVITKTTTTKTSRKDTLVKKQPEDAPGFFGRLKGWFTGSSNSDTTITLLYVEERIKIDTLRHSWVPTDSLLRDVIGILNEIRTQQEETISKLSAKELELLKTDLKLMDEVRSVVSLLEFEELQDATQRSQNARDVVSRSTILIASLGGLAVFMTILFIIIIFRDITLSNYYRLQLEEAKKLAEQLLKAKEEFLANMSHEIRTPLTSIIGFTRQMKKTPLGPNQHDFVRSLEFSSEHLLDIVNDLLDISKIEAGQLKLESVPINPLSLIKEAVDLFRTKAQDRGLDLKYTASCECSSPVLGDSYRLKQIVINLVGNAIKFTEKGSVKVDVSCSQLANQEVEFVLTVTDTGIGIEPDRLNDVFKRFSQADSGITRRFGGTGLGLSIVKKLTEMHQGSVSGSSEVGKGSVFTVTLRYKLASNIDSIPESTTGIPATLPTNLKILLIDDDPLLQQLSKLMLNSLGSEPTILGNPAQAIELLSKSQFDVVLSDIQMPVISGFDLVKRLREMDSVNRRTIAIAITANSIGENVDTYLKAGFDGVLFKPFDEFALFNAIAVHFGIEDNQVNIVNAESDSSFDLSDIKRFCEGDNEAFYASVNSVIVNNNQNIKLLNEYAATENWKGIKEVTHKMKSAMGQIRAMHIQKMVMEIDTLDLSKENILHLKHTISEIAKAFLEVEKLMIKAIEEK